MYKKFFIIFILFFFFLFISCGTVPVNTVFTDMSIPVNQQSKFYVPGSLYNSNAILVSINGERVDIRNTTAFMFVEPGEHELTIRYFRRELSGVEISSRNFNVNVNFVSGRYYTLVGADDKMSPYNRYLDPNTFFYAIIDFTEPSNPIVISTNHDVTSLNNAVQFTLVSGQWSRIKEQFDTVIQRNRL